MSEPAQPKRQPGPRHRDSDRIMDSP